MGIGVLRQSLGLYRCRSSLRPVFLLFMLFHVPCLAQAPVLLRLDPPGGQQGEALVLKLVGRNLPPDPRIMTPLPATFAPMTARSGSLPQRAENQILPYLVELDPEVSVGLYPIRVSSPEGLSNILLFSVGAFAEVREEESLLLSHQGVNDSPESSQILGSLPVTVNGTLNGPDRDVYRIEGQKADMLVFEVEARRCGSAVDPFIQLLDSREKEVASNDDAPGLDVDSRLDVRLPESGPYYVVVHDSRFSEQTDNFYRLKIGSFSYADALFPLGGRRGTKVDVELLGGNLPQPTKVTLDLGQIGEEKLVKVVPPGFPGALPMLFRASDLPEVMAPDGSGSMELDAGTIINGRISQPGEVDRYTLDVSGGERWAIEILAAGLKTSLLSGLIMVHDEEGRRIASAGDDSPRAGVDRVIPRGLTSSDPHLNLTVPDGVTRLLVSVEDLVNRGGPSFGYRLEARREPPDFTLVLKDPFINLPAGGSARLGVKVNRRGYKGAIRLGVSGDVDGLLIRGGDISPDTSAESVSTDEGALTITAGPGAKPEIRELVVWGESVSGEGPVIRRSALAPGMITNVLVGTGRSAAPTVRDVQKPFTAPWLGLNLPVMVTNELPVRVVLEGPERIRLVQGAEQMLKWRLEPEGPAVPSPELILVEAPGAREIDVKFLDEQGRRLKSSPIENPGFKEGRVRLQTTTGTSLGQFNVLVNVDIKVAGEIRRLYSPAIAGEVIQGYEIEVVADPVRLGPGGEAELVGRVSRSEGFNEWVDIHVENLPPGVSCAPVHVDSGEDQFAIPCEALDSSPPGDYDIELISSSVFPDHEKENVPYSIPAVQARLTVRDHRGEESPGPGG